MKLRFRFWNDVRALWYCNKKIWGHTLVFSVLVWAILLPLGLDSPTLLIIGAVVMWFVAEKCAQLREAITATIGSTQDNFEIEQIEQEIPDMWHGEEPQWAEGVAPLISAIIFWVAFLFTVFLKGFLHMAISKVIS